MMYHILVESESAFQFPKTKFAYEKDKVWHTTSPWLLEYLSQLGEDVISLEEECSASFRTQ